MKTGIELIAEERQEQLNKHNWTHEHDDGHVYGELRVVAAILCVQGTDHYVNSNFQSEYSSGQNAWGLEEKLKRYDIHRLKVAGALIAAEIDRLQRKTNAAGQQEVVEDIIRKPDSTGAL